MGGYYVNTRNDIKNYRFYTRRIGKLFRRQ